MSESLDGQALVDLVHRLRLDNADLRIGHRIAHNKQDELLTKLEASRAEVERLNALLSADSGKTRRPERGNSRSSSTCRRRWRGCRRQARQSWMTR